MEIRCVKGMYRLKLVSSENNSGFRGLISLLLHFHSSTFESVHHHDHEEPKRSMKYNKKRLQSTN